MKRSNYQVVDRKDSRKLAEFLSKNGQLLLPMLELIEQSEMAVDELIDTAGRATIEAILLMSATELAGPRQAGKRRTDNDIRWYGRQKGVVNLAERKLRVDKPRLRRRGRGQQGEVDIPAYRAMQRNGRLGQRMLEILMAGISTRQYQKVLPAMAETVGVSKSSVSREFIEASSKALKTLAERRFDDQTILIVYIDGLVLGNYHVIAAIGVDEQGHKHVLGIRQGATENAVVVKALLEDLVARGVGPEQRRLYVIDGSQALRCGIDSVYGSDNPVQRCRKHKERNVLGYLPEQMKDQVYCTLKAAWKLNADEGMAKLQQLADWLENEHPSAAASLREGLTEMFTINRLQLPASLRRCLGSTNVIESSFSGTQGKTRRVTHWQNGSMVCRWAATALLETEKHFKRIMGYEQLWILKAHLDDANVDTSKKVG